MKSNFTMLDNLQLGIKPTKEGFQEVIDKVNDWNKANGKATEYQIDNLADCQSALVDYVEMQGLAGYAAKEATGTIQGSWSSLKGAWENLLVGLADGNQDLDVLVENTINSAGKVLENVIPRVKQIFKSLIKIVKNYLTNIDWNEVGKNLLNAFENAYNIVVEYFSNIDWGPIIDSIISFFQNIDYEGIAEALFELFGKAVANLVKLGIVIGEHIKQALNDAITYFQDMAEESGGNIVAGILEGIADAIIGIGQWIYNHVFIPFIDGFKSAFGIHSPSTVMAQMGSFLIDGLKNGLLGIWDRVKSIFENLKNNVISKFTDIKNNMSNKANEAKNAVLNIFENIKNGIQNKIDSAKEKVKNAIDKIKGFFNFSWSLPKLKTPHFNITGSFSLNPPSVPKIGIDWYKEGGILEGIMTEPTIFGFSPRTGNAQIGGEAGAEAITPINKLLDMIRIANNESNNGVIIALNSILNLLVGYMPEMINLIKEGKYIVLDDGTLVGTISEKVDKNLNEIFEKRKRGS